MSRVANATLALAINRFCPPVFGFLLLVIVGLRSSELLGWYTVVTVFYFALQTLPFLGLTPLIVKEGARRPKDAGRIFATSVGIAGAVTLVLCLALPVVLRFADLPLDVESAVWICALTTIPYVIAYSAELILVSFDEPWLLGSVPLVENSLRLCASFAALQMGHGITALFWFTFAGRVVAAIVLSVALRRRVLRDLPMHFDIAMAKNWLGQCPVFFLHAATYLVTSRAAVVVLSRVVGSVAVANFSVGYRVLDLGTVGLTAFAGAVYPGMAKAAAAEDRDEFRRSTAISTKLALAMGTVLAILALSGSEVFVAVLFPRQFPDAVAAMQILMVSFVAVGMRLMLSGAMFAADRPAWDLSALVLGAVSYVVLLVWLVPSFGVVGAAAATVAEAAIQASIRVAIARSDHITGPLLRHRTGTTLIVSAILLALSVATCAWIHDPYWRLCTGIACGAVYLLVLRKSGALRAEDLAFLGIGRSGKSVVDGVPGGRDEV
ncbi:MAG: oligosaccharide flippase family protein [Planctomycetota bacterium]